MLLSSLRIASASSCLVGVRREGSGSEGAKMERRDLSAFGASLPSLGVNGLSGELQDILCDMDVGKLGKNTMRSELNAGVFKERK